MNKLQNFSKGLIKENPVLVLVLGTCPTLATSTSVTNALGMGAVANLYNSGDLAVKCLLAGDDILLMPADLSAAVKGVENAVANGTLTEERIDESVLRILALKEKRGILK